MAAMPLRNIRVDDELWEAVADKAAVEGRTASEVVRELLTAWVAKAPKPVDRPKLKTWRS